MSTTSDRDDPRLGHGADAGPGPQNEAYLVLSDEDRARGFVRPLRLSYRHAGAPGPQFPLRDLTLNEQEHFGAEGYVKYEAYAEEYRGSATGRFWTQAQLNEAGKGCGVVTKMNRAIAETYAVNPSFYGATYCCGCHMHLPVGPQGEFTWTDADGRDTGERVGT